MFDGLDTAIQLLFIGPRDLLAWAEPIRPYIAKMATESGGRYESSDLFAILAAGRMLLWVVVEGAEIRCVCVGEIVNYPRLRALRLVGLAGNHPLKWRRMLMLIEGQAKQQFGCGMMESMHQPRHRVFSPGYRTTHWLSEKSL